MLDDLDLAQLRTLLAVAEQGGFEAAARELNLTQPAVSQRLRALERRAGRVLVTRTRPVTVTESGAVLLRYARQLARLAGDAAAELGGGDEPGTGEPAPPRVPLAIAVNADSLATWFLPALAAVPDRLRTGFCLYREDQERTAELLRRGQVAAAVTSSPRPVPGCRVQPLGGMRYLAMASPGFARRYLPGPDLAGAGLARALAGAPVVVFDRDDDLQDAFLRELAGTAAGAGAGAADPVRHQVPASEAFVAAVAAGLGWGMIPDQQAARMPPGALAGLAPGRYLDVPLYWQRWKLDSPPLAALTEAVSAAAAGLRPVSALRPVPASAASRAGTSRGTPAPPR